MHRLVKKNRKSKGDGDLRLQWPTEEKGLDALDRELSLLMSVKRWVAGATGGQTPRSIKETNPNQLKKPKVIDHKYQERTIKVEALCRQLGLRMLACRDGLVRDLKKIEQSRVDEMSTMKRRFKNVKSHGYFNDREEIDHEKQMKSSQSTSRLRLNLSASSLSSSSRLGAPGLLKSTSALSLTTLGVPAPKNSRQMKLVKANFDFNDLMATTNMFFKPGTTVKEKSLLLKSKSRTVADAWMEAGINSNHGLGLSKSMIPSFDETSNSDFTLANTANKAIMKRQQLTEEEYHSRVKALIHELKPEMETVRVLHRQLGAKWNMVYCVVKCFLKMRKAHIKHMWEKEVLNAVILIQAYWRARMARKNVRALKALGPTFKSIIWRYILKIKCQRRTRMSQILRKFANDYASRWVQQMVYNFRRCVVKCQRIIRSWLACKHARILALSKIWDKVEKTEENQKLLRHMIVLSDTTDLDKDGDGSISSAEIKAAAKAERGAEKNFLVINAKQFDSSYMKAYKILVKANMSRMKNSAKMQELERQARWNKWRGGFARCCKSAFVKAILEPHLAKVRKHHMEYSHKVRTRVTKGATKADMQSFVRGETWDDLMSRIKPSAPPLILYTSITEQKMLDYVMSGLLMQMQFDKDLELRKLHIWDEEDEKNKRNKAERKRKEALLAEEEEHA
jgi:hypothetical protein